jgi:hypothetical protein
MPALVHVFLHLGLCNAVAQAPPETIVPMHVTMNYRVGGAEIDKVFRETRGTGTQAVIEFDVPRSLYRLQVDVPKYRCGVSDFVDVLPATNREVTETLVDGGAPAPKPVTIMDGTAPMSFVYTKPTFVVFDSSVTCDKPIGPLVPTQIDVQYGQGAYYASFYNSIEPLPRGRGLTVALRLRTTTGLAHYVHLPIPFPLGWSGWPSSVTFNVTEDMIDGLATEKTDTLLCPKLWETSVQ